MITVDILTIMFVLAVFNLLAALFFFTYIQLTQIKLNLNFFILSKTFQGLSWLLRLIVYTKSDYWIIAAADLLLLFGFALESMLFVLFKGKISKRLRLFYIVSLGIISSTVFIFGQSIPVIKDLFLLLGYIMYMSIISWKLIMRTEATRFQRLIGITYGTLPILSSLMFVAITQEVTVVGKATSVIGIFYYVSILLMQLIGGVGYLLIVNERDESNLRESAVKDPLTGILNRRAFYEYATLLVHKAIRDNSSVSVIMIDVDHFKRINDSFGHIFGDKILRLLCETLTFEMRKEDLLARYGGEEFIIFITGADEIALTTFVNRIHHTVSERVSHFYTELSPFTVSMGVYSCVPNEKNDLEIMIKHSDDALYQSKNNGRNKATLMYHQNGVTAYKELLRTE